MASNGNSLSGSVLITGGAGFLGRGILRRSRRDNWPARFTVYSRDEQKQDACKHRYPEADYVVGDILDTERLTLAMLGCETVVHAAAFKYVPEAEQNVAECVRINVDGTRAVIRAARAAHVRKLLFVSTDKAVEPINVYGLTKALGERLVAEAGRRNNDTGLFTAVCRYGNVIGSTGSAIPLFQRQLREEGRVRITDPHMTRFWMSVDEAIDLITYSQHTLGCLIVPPARAMTVLNLAQAVMGYNSDKYAPSVTIGMRPGEKRHEKLMTYVEGLRVDYIGPPYYVIRESGDLRCNIGELTSDKAPEIPVTEMQDLIADAADV